MVMVEELKATNAENYGEVQVWMGSTADSFTAFVGFWSGSALLYGPEGSSISTASHRLGYHGKRNSGKGGYRDGVQLVADDNVSDETFAALIDAGYPIVRRG
jgi:hypothetical protein